MKKVLVTGAGGQLATELQKCKPETIDMVAAGRAQLDITDYDAVQRFVSDGGFDVIINAAAYTAVDKAETEKERAYAVNAQGAENLAKAAGSDCYLLHVSTDFVFDGTKNRPYQVDDAPGPTSVYGESKLKGEQLLFAAKPSSCAVIRTSWVYSAHGNNFVKSMLRFMAERPELNIVVDQIGTPTWAKTLARVCWRACDGKIEGVFHWSDAGTSSWYDFAEAIQSLGLYHGLLGTKARLSPIPTEGYPLPARRPAYSVMDKSALLNALPEIENTHWREQLELMIIELKELKN